MTKILQNCVHSPLNSHAYSRQYIHLFFPVIPFNPLSLSFQSPLPQTMLCGNCFDFELPTRNIEWGSRKFYTVYCSVQRVVLFGASKVLLKDNVSTKLMPPAVVTREMCWNCEDNFTKNSSNCSWSDVLNTKLSQGTSTVFKTKSNK